MSLCNLRFLVELTYLHVIVKCESLLGDHGKPCRSVIFVTEIYSADSGRHINCKMLLKS